MHARRSTPIAVLASVIAAALLSLAAAPALAAPHKPAPATTTTATTPAAAKVTKKAEPDYPRQWFVQLETHASFLSDVADRSILGTTFGYAARGGYRFGRWGVFVSIEHNMWVTSDVGTTVRAGALNIGVGGSVIYAGGHIRSSLTFGPSVLLHRTLLDEPGTTGVFFDVRPAGIRFPLGRHVSLCFDPISLALIMPVLTGIPLVMVEYRTTLNAEMHF